MRKFLSRCLPLLLTAPLAWAQLPIEHWVQPSGARVYFIHSPSLPMVDLQIDLDAGSRRDPPDQPELTRQMVGQLDSGTRAHAGDPLYPQAMDQNELTEAWADLGARFGVSAGSDRVSIQLRSLSDPRLLSRALALASRQLMHPAFPDDIWQRDREQQLSGLREALTRPGIVASRAFSDAIFGDHPYGRQMQPASLERLSVQDFQQAHARLLRPCLARVSVVGALTRAQVDAMVQRLLAPWPSTCPSLPPVPEVAPLQAAREIRLPMATAQTHLIVGQPGHARADPDFFALMLGNHSLGGGGFTSRLMQEVREQRGLVYSVYSSFNPGRHAGAFSIGLQTRPTQAEEALQVVRQTLRRFVQEGPTEQELADAKANMIGGQALRQDSNAKLLANLSNIAWNDLPLDYLQTWGAQLQKVDRAAVQGAMARVLQPDRMVTVLVGPTEAGARP